MLSGSIFVGWVPHPASEGGCGIHPTLNKRQRCWSQERAS